MLTNKKLWACAILLGASVLSLLPGTADAQKKPKTEEPEPNIAADLASTGSLIEFGRKYKVPAALVDAGAILIKVQRANLKQITDQPTIELPKDAAKETAKVKTLADQADDLFDEATALATDQKAIRAQIKAAKVSEGTRGVSGGPKQHQAMLQKGATHTHRWRFKGGMPGYVAFQSTSIVTVRVTSVTGEVVGFGQGMGGQTMFHPGPVDKEYIVTITSMTVTNTTYTLLSN